MSTAFLALMGFTAVTLTALVATFGAWYRSVQDHWQDLSDRGRLALKFALPTFLLVTTAAVVYVSILFAGRTFPTVGVSALATGLVGAFTASGYVYFDLQTPIDDRTTTRTDVEDADAAT